MMKKWVSPGAWPWGGGREGSRWEKNQVHRTKMNLSLRGSLCKDTGKGGKLQPWAHCGDRHQWDILATAQIGGAMPSDSGACQRTRTLMVWTKTDSDDQAGRGQTAGDS